MPREITDLKIETKKLKAGGEIISVLWKDQNEDGGDIWSFSALSISKETLADIFKTIITESKYIKDENNKRDEEIRNDQSGHNGDDSDSKKIR